MQIAGSYTGEVDLDGSGRDNDDLVDTHSVSVSQDLLPEGRLSAEALAVHDRRDQLRLARLRLQRVRNEVALQVARTFLTLTERTGTMAILEDRLAFAERDLEQIRFRVAQGAADRLALLDATIAVTEQRNSLDAQRAALALDTDQFFADLGRTPAPLAVPAAGDPGALRGSAHALLAEPTPAAAIAGALGVLESGGRAAQRRTAGRAYAARRASGRLARSRLPQGARRIAARFGEPVDHRQLHAA